MTQTYIDAINPQSQVAEMHLYGSIGNKIDGDLFARELASLDRQCNQVNIRGNCPGGDVLQGMSIVSAILSMVTPVHVYVDGIMASMGAVIAVCADRVIMQDFAKLMIHDPFFSDNGAMTAKQRKMLDKIRDMLLGVLMRRGKNEEEISRLMTEETWFSAKEARELNLCDEILASNRAESFLRLTPQQIITQISAEYQPQNQNVMNLTNEAAELLKLKAEATEAEVSAAVVALHGRVATQTKRADDAEQRAKAAENELSEIRKAQAEERKKEAETLVATAIKDGRINAAAQESYLALFEKDHEAAKTALASIPRRTNIANQIGGKDAAPERQAKLEAMSWEQFDKGGFLADLKANNRDLYDRKFEERFHRKPSKQ